MRKSWTIGLEVVGVLSLSRTRRAKLAELTSCFAAGGRMMRIGRRIAVALIRVRVTCLRLPLTRSESRAEQLGVRETFLRQTRHAHGEAKDRNMYPCVSNSPRLASSFDLT